MQILCSSSVPLMNRPTPLIRPFSLSPHPNKFRAANRTASMSSGESEIDRSVAPFHLKYTQQRYEVSLITYCMWAGGLTPLQANRYACELQIRPSRSSTVHFPQNELLRSCQHFRSHIANGVTRLSKKTAALFRRTSQSFKFAFATRSINDCSAASGDLQVVLHFPVSSFPP